MTSCSGSFLSVNTTKVSFSSFFSGSEICITFSFFSSWLFNSVSGLSTLIISIFSFSSLTVCSTVGFISVLISFGSSLFCSIIISFFSLDSFSILFSSLILSLLILLSRVSKIISAFLSSFSLFNEFLLLFLLTLLLFFEDSSFLLFLSLYKSLFKSLSLFLSDLFSVSITFFEFSLATETSSFFSLSSLTFLFD